MDNVINVREHITQNTVGNSTPLSNHLRGQISSSTNEEGYSIKVHLRERSGKCTLLYYLVQTTQVSSFPLVYVKVGS